MAFKKILALFNLGSGFDIDVGNSKINVASQVGTVIVDAGVFLGRSQNGTSVTWQERCTVTNRGVGRWKVVFDSAHPRGVHYHVSGRVEEQYTTLDPASFSVVQGSQTELGFSFMLTVPVLDSVTDTYASVPWSFAVLAPVELAIKL